VVGTIINTAAIVVGGLAGCLAARQLSPRVQLRLKTLLGALVIYVGLSTTWRAINGSFGQVLKQIAVVLLALVLGNVVGKRLRLQGGLNRLGEFAKTRLAGSTDGSATRWGEGVVTCTLLFCVGPMAILGALQDGLTGDFRTLAIKGIMDGLAAMAFVTTFGWSVMLAALPVLAYQGTITLLAQWAAPFLEDRAVLDAINATGGLLVVCISLVIFEVKKVPLADYLPSLGIAPLLAWWWR
jgi:uncharacterized membrane protein YqgA involved in biofilm formation